MAYRSSTRVINLARAKLIARVDKVPDWHRFEIAYVEVNVMLFKVLWNVF